MLRPVSLAIARQEQRSSDQCQPVHAKNPQHGSPDSGPVAAQPARVPIATASSAMNIHRPLSPISEHPIKIIQVPPQDRLAV
jgi:hypothetical protein